MVIALLLFNGTLIAGLYALGRVAGDEGVSPLGLLYWQAFSAAIVLGAASLVRRERLPISWAHLRYYAVAGLLGTTLPYWATYASLAHLPAGVVGIMGSLSALFTYGIARTLGMEQANRMRMLGIAAGLGGVVGIMGPKSALPEASMAPWVLLAAAAPLALAGANIYRTHAWPPGLSPLSAASGMLLVQVVGLAPVVALADAWILPGPCLERVDVTLLLLSGLASAVYAGSFVLQRLSGPVIVSQLGYVITLATIAIGVGLLGERYSGWVWFAVALVFLGLYLVNRNPSHRVRSHGIRRVA
jgi:drug/metabolite transporter (DMT)-like permease